jgi:threonine dehydrogenase-like Zn-dependent dehydrogenase
VPEHGSDEEAVLCEPVAAACEIQERLGRLRGERVAVLGDGKLGLLIAQVLQVGGAALALFGRYAAKMAIAERAMIAGRFPLREAARAGASVLCFPACSLPGYRDPARGLPPPDARTLEAAWATLTEATRRAGITAILGTERPAVKGLHAAALVLNPAGPLRFGVTICHEGWRYPETVRRAAENT